ncbi:MAG: ATP-binding protein [Bacteroidales bacterium]|nr:ATP-binding protein [Bacteroidales bacterium]MDD4209417.1 ATP-binding protein [Bacteroidales bacterium]
MENNFIDSHTLKLIIPNEMSMIYPVQQTAKAYAEMLGFEKKECYHIELLLEEILSNSIKYDFMPGQKESIDITLHKTTLGLSVTIHSNSIPLDIEKIKSFSSIEKENIIKYNASGIGSLLIHKLADNVNYINKGKEGQFIYFEKNIAGKAFNETQSLTNFDSNITPKTAFTFYVRRLKPEESLFISQLAYFAYRVSYIYDKIYYPEYVKKLNEEGEMLSIVGVNRDNEEIIGHVAAIKHEISGLPEMGVAFVNPHYRGGGCLQQTSEYLINLLRTQKNIAAIVHAVTTHPYSQKAAYKLNFRETAVYISRATPLLMNEIKEEQLIRESLLLMLLLLHNNDSKQIYVPTHHAKMIQDIYANIGQKIEILEAKHEPFNGNNEAVVEVSTDSYSCGFIIVKHYGSNIIALVHKTLKSLCINRIESIYIYLPLDNPEVSRCCSEFEKADFFFGGIVHHAGGQHYLMLQYLNNQQYDYESLHVFSDFAKILVNYIHRHDPNQNMS